MPNWFQKRPKTAPKALTAAGEVLDASTAARVLTQAGTNSGWQTEAWAAHDSIGEVAEAYRFVANAVSKIQLYVAQSNDEDDEPTPTDSEACTLSPDLIQAATEELDRLPYRSGYAFLGVLATCFGVVGEANLHGFTTPDDGETWVIRSTNEVTTVNGKLAVVDSPGATPRQLNTPLRDPLTGVTYTPKETLIRLWVPSAQWKQLADSPVRTALNICRRVMTIDREIQAVATSRLARNGILFLGDSFALPSEGVTAGETNRFQAALQNAMLAPMSLTEGAENLAAVPIVVSAPDEYIEKAARHITLERESSESVLEKRNAEITRLLNSLDVPKEAVTGYADTKYSNAFVIDAATFKHHIEPLIRLIVDSLTAAYLRTALTLPVKQGGHGFAAEDVAQIRIWYDAGNITENSNRGDDAESALQIGAISYETYRKARGFNEGDAADDDDIDLLLKVKAAAFARDHESPSPRVIQSPTPSRAITTPSRALPESAPGEHTPPSGSRVASAAPVVDTRIVTNEKLVRIDDAALTELVEKANAALTRGLEKAGQRSKSRAQKHPQIAAHLNTITDPVAALHSLSDTQTEQLGLTDDQQLNGTWDAYELVFTLLAAEVVRKAAATAAKLAAWPVANTSALTATMLARIGPAWQRLRGALDDYSRKALRGPTGTGPGETGTGPIPAGVIRDALNEIGGGNSTGGKADNAATPSGGIATGTTVTAALSEAFEAPPIGVRWQYNGLLARNTFEPHYRLDGRRFTSMSDPGLTPPPDAAWLGVSRMYPGDHRGCTCSTTIAWITSTDTTNRRLVGRALNDHTAMVNASRLAVTDDETGLIDSPSQQARALFHSIATQRADWFRED